MMRKLIFVYNAKGGRLNTAFDMAHKLISPDTYACNLCSITHGVFSEREAWKAFRESSTDALLFLHKDEFEAQYAERYTYPVVLLEQGGGRRVLLSADDINRAGDVDGLIALLQARLG